MKLRLKFPTRPQASPVLDAEQQAAVDYDGSVLLIALPGSGKTRCIQAKSFNAPALTLATTFNREAAAEMRRRCGPIEVRTIHSLSLRETGVMPLDSSGGPDFDALIYDYLAYPHKSHYDLLLLDEGHTLSANHLHILKELTPSRIFSVADFCQQIYIWNGAYKGLFTDLEKWGCRVMYLYNNHRSNQDVVDVLEAVYNRHMVAKGPSELKGDIGILAKTNEELQVIEELLLRAEVSFESHIRENYQEKAIKRVYGKSPHIFLYTIHSSIGLEFDKVFVMDWYGRLTVEEVNVLYVGLSRARVACHLVNFYRSSPGLGQVLLKGKCPVLDFSGLLRRL